VHSRNYISKFTAGQGGQLVQFSQCSAQTETYKETNSGPVVVPVRVVKMYTSDFGLDVFMLRKHFFQIATGAYM